MIFETKLYRATSRNKKAKKSDKLIISSNDSMHYRSKASKVKELRALGCKMSKSHKDYKKLKYSENNRVAVELTVYFPTRRKSDPDNLQPTLKAIMDGFTDSGIWDDDNYKTIIYTKYKYGGLSGCDRYKLSIELIDNIVE